MTKSATALSSWVHVIRRVLDQSGHDGSALMREAGLVAESGPHSRYPLSATTRLWRLAVATTGDDALGLKVASAVKPGTFLVLELSLGASRNLKEMFERIVRYFYIVSDAAELSFQRSGDEYHLNIHPLTQGPQPAAEAIDAFTSLFVRMCRASLDRSFSPLRIELRRQAPHNLAAFTALLRAPLYFGAARNALVLSAFDCEQRLPSADPELAREGDALVRRYLARQQRDNIAVQVQTVLVEQLPRGEPDQADIAAYLNLSTRSLQRRLASAQTSYRQILDVTRRELADNYLQDQRYSIVEIAYLLGYGDSSNFSRACRRWFDCSPSQYRAACKNLT